MNALAMLVFASIARPCRMQRRLGRELASRVDRCVGLRREIETKRADFTRVAALCELAEQRLDLGREPRRNARRLAALIQRLDEIVLHIAELQRRLDTERDAAHELRLRLERLAIKNMDRLEPLPEAV